MQVVFISNFLSHHQRPFCDRMYATLGDGFLFISTKPITQERINMGWSMPLVPYELRAYENEEQSKSAQTMALQADVVIIGSAPDFYIIPRLKAGKLTFKYSERFYKQGLNAKNFAHALIGAWLHHGRFQRYPLYMLCASAYTAGDCAVFGNYKNRTFQWGYFPEAKYYDVNELMGKKSGLKHPCASILWVGRLIGWKHPDASIHLAESLKRQGYEFKLNIIGNGDLEQELQMMISDKGLSDCVEMLGAMPPEKVRERMEKADIFLFTSDFNEGWGAVLNESMNSGCAVVASHAVGSVPFLIQDGENGLIYENGNQRKLEERVESLIRNSGYRKKLGVNAYESIVNTWNADAAAERFIALSQALLNGKAADSIFKEGPCSRATIINNDWYTKDDRSNNKI